MTDLENHQFPTNIIINSGKDHQSMLKPVTGKEVIHTISQFTLITFIIKRISTL